MYLCQLLHLPYTVLIAQPDWWVERMVLWHDQKTKAEAIHAKEQQRRSRAR